VIVAQDRVDLAVAMGDQPGVIRAKSGATNCKIAVIMSSIEPVEGQVAW